MPYPALRDIKKQHNEFNLMQQQKKSAQGAIRGLCQQQDQQKALSVKLANARRDLECLVIYEKHVCDVACTENICMDSCACALTEAW